MVTELQHARAALPAARHPRRRTRRAEDARRRRPDDGHGGQPAPVRARRLAGAPQVREPPAHRARSSCAAPTSGSPACARGAGAGVVAASAGNHAQGVALAASLLGVRSTVFMPEGAPLPKVAATRDYGAEVRLHGQVVDETLAAAQEYAQRDGRGLHPPLRPPRRHRGPGHGRPGDPGAVPRGAHDRGRASAAADSRPGSRSR